MKKIFGIKTRYWKI